jgi:hypothetical protein
MRVGAKQVNASLCDALPISWMEANRIRRIVFQVAREGLAQDGILEWERLGVFRVVVNHGSVMFPAVRKHRVSFRASRSALERIEFHDR